MFIRATKQMFITRAKECKKGFSTEALEKLFDFLIKLEWARASEVATDVNDTLGLYEELYMHEVCDMCGCTEIDIPELLQFVAWTHNNEMVLIRRM